MGKLLRKGVVGSIKDTDKKQHEVQSVLRQWRNESVEIVCSSTQTHPNPSATLTHTTQKTDKIPV